LDLNLIIGGVVYMQNYEFNKLMLSGQSYNNKVTMEIPMDCDLYEFINACKVIAIGLTYSEQSWETAIINLAGDYTEQDSYRQPKKAINLTDDLPF
jgi:hypothetical protein